MKLAYLSILVFACVSDLKAQQPIANTSMTEEQYVAKQKAIGKAFSSYFYPNYARVHTLSEKKFVVKIDSTRQLFLKLLAMYRSQLRADYVALQETEIKYYFDKLLIEYPYTHEVYAGNSSSSYPLIMRRVIGNRFKFDDPALLKNSDFVAYVKAFLGFELTKELKKLTYRGHYNKNLDAIWAVIAHNFSNRECRAFWQYENLTWQMQRNGIKGTEEKYHNFLSTCRDTTYTNKLKKIYHDLTNRQLGHVIREYKHVSTYGLDLHLFLPEKGPTDTKKPVIVFFYGGSWSEGNPEWHFDVCQRYAQLGWVACAAEYRIYGKQGTSPFEAVMDARSVIRWLRKQANEFTIDTSQIVATGNSAGGHLVLATALAAQVNEKTDDLSYSPIPNLLLVNAGVYDLTDEKTAWIRKELPDKTSVETLSPLHLVKRNMPPILLIHAQDDQNVSYSSAKKFSDQTTALGNLLELHTLPVGGHFIFADPAYSSQIANWRKEFLVRLGYPNNPGD